MKYQSGFNQTGRESLPPVSLKKSAFAEALQSISKGRQNKVLNQLKRGRPTLQGKGMKKIFNNATEALNFSAKVREAIENARMRSAWDRGVQTYALELLDNYDEYAQ